ncbi:hypothetical protein H0H92_000416 [Tricholoma furcatifolium]|nr:hypothetical protein H0H92_000416 [Tricholoma furcatifolium]
MAMVNDQDVFDNSELSKQLAMIQQELEKERERNEDLERQVQEAVRLAEERDIAEKMAEVPAESIPRPVGTAGQDWGIQMAMGLGRSARKDEIYKGIQVKSKVLHNVKTNLIWHG